MFPPKKAISFSRLLTLVNLLAQNIHSFLTVRLAISVIHCSEASFIIGHLVKCRFRLKAPIESHVLVGVGLVQWSL
jgi:hypothetical protein